MRRNTIFVDTFAWLALANRSDHYHESAPSVTVVQVTEELYDLAWSLYQQRGDKDWGITDCTSLQVMSMLGISRAFTNDQHFEQAGFELVRCSS